jgi:hypothetical protein
MLCVVTRPWAAIRAQSMSTRTRTLSLSVMVLLPFVDGRDAATAHASLSMNCDPRNTLHAQSPHPRTPGHCRADGK